MTILYEALDPGVVDAVRYLRDRGWNTTYSCQGGEGHSEKHPIIQLDLGKMDDIEDLGNCLFDGGYKVFKIDASLQVAHCGFWVRRAVVTLGEWM